MIEILNRQKNRRVERAPFEALLRSLVRRYGLRKAEVALTFVDDAAIRRLNRTFRGLNKPTDVLSFPVMERNPEGFFQMGDIIISVPRAAAQAERLGHSLSFELRFLTLHGFLHLLGFEHGLGHEEEEERLAKALLRKRRSR